MLFLRVTVALLLCMGLAHGADATPAQALAKTLGDGGASDRIAAAKKLARLDEGLAEVVPALVKGLGDEYFEVRRNCRNALVSLGRDVVPHLRDLVTKGNYHERTNALRVLGKLGRDASDAVPEVVGALSHSDWQTRAEAMDALGRMSPAEYLAAFEGLVRALADPHLPGGAALLIRQINASAPDARKKMEPAMRRLLQSQDASEVLLALEMLQKMGVKLSEEEMAGAMGRVKAHDPEWLIETVKREKTGAVWAVPALLGLLKDGGGEWPVARICDALFLVGKASAPAIPTLIKTLDHPGPGAQRYAARALGQLGGKAASALPGLRKLAKEAKDAQVRQWATNAIESIEDGK